MRRNALTAVLSSVLIYALLLGGTWTFSFAQNATLACNVISSLEEYAASCSLPQANRSTALQGVVKSIANCTSLEVDKELRLAADSVFSALLPQLRSYSSQYANDTGLHVALRIPPGNFSTFLNSEGQQSALTYSDGYIASSSDLVNLAQSRSMLAPLEPLLFANLSLDWFGIAQGYRLSSARFAGATWGVPLSGSSVLMYYRSDILSLSQVPRTWKQVEELAKAYQGRDLNGDGQADYSFCFQRGKGCGRLSLLSMAAPLVQAGGRAQGLLIDSTNGSSLLTSVGWQAALQMLQTMRAYSPASEDASCGDVNVAFASGRCLMTLHASFEMFKALSQPGAPMRHSFGITSAPGSEVVMERGQNEMQPCTPMACPYGSAMPSSMPTMAAAVVGSHSGSTSSSPSPSSTINLAPLLADIPLGLLQGRNPQALRVALMAYWTEVSTPGASWQRVLARGSGVAPFRTSQWSGAEALRHWTTSGAPLNASMQLVAALQAMHTSSNFAIGLKIPGSNAVNAHLDDAVQALCQGQLPRTVSEALDGRVNATLAGIYPSWGAFLATYWSSVDYVRPFTPVVPAPRPDTRASSDFSVGIIAVIVVMVLLVFALMCLAALEVRNKRMHKDVFGRVIPPPIGPETTIMVAAIQDYDVLWQSAVDSSSEAALQLLTHTARRLLACYSGYLTPSQDELLVAAFHNARDAALFALHFQQELLLLPWPQHLLDLEPFKPIHYTPTNATGTSFSRARGSVAAAAAGPAGGPRMTGGPSAIVDGAGGGVGADDDDKLFSLALTSSENVSSFGEQCRASWSVAEATAPCATLVFRGVCVSVGLCAVVSSAMTASLEPCEGRMVYCGEPVDIATLVADAAQGGMLILPQGTFRQLHLEVMVEQALFCHYGEYQVQPELPPMDVYLAVDRSLLARLTTFMPLRAHAQWSNGAFSAPVRSAAMVFTHVVGVQALLAWRYDLMQAAIELFMRLAQAELKDQDGYLVEHVDGFMLTAFSQPANAIAWGLRMQELMLRQDWPAELLSHELCEEVTVEVQMQGQAGRTADTPLIHAGTAAHGEGEGLGEGEAVAATVFRGPRLKTGIDIGEVLARLHTMTGRMTYRGKVMNRAARISAAASSGQVLCSAEAWDGVARSGAALSEGISASSLGLFQLKGIAERIQVYHCTYAHALADVTVVEHEGEEAAAAEDKETPGQEDGGVLDTSSLQLLAVSVPLGKPSLYSFPACPSSSRHASASLQQPTSPPALRSRLAHSHTAAAEATTGATQPDATLLGTKNGGSLLGVEATHAGMVQKSLDGAAPGHLPERVGLPAGHASMETDMLSYSMAAAEEHAAHAAGAVAGSAAAAADRLSIGSACAPTLAGIGWQVQANDHGEASTTSADRGADVFSTAAAAAGMAAVASVASAEVASPRSSAGPLLALPFTLPHGSAGQQGQEARASLSSRMAQPAPLQAQHLQPQPAQAGMHAGLVQQAALRPPAAALSTLVSSPQRSAAVAAAATSGGGSAGSRRGSAGASVGPGSASTTGSGLCRGSGGWGATTRQAAWIIGQQRQRRSSALVLPAAAAAAAHGRRVATDAGGHDSASAQGQARRGSLDFCQQLQQHARASVGNYVTQLMGAQLAGSGQLRTSHGSRLNAAHLATLAHMRASMTDSSDPIMLPIPVQAGTSSILSSGNYAHWPPAGGAILLRGRMSAVGAREMDAASGSAWQLLPRASTGMAPRAYASAVQPHGQGVQHPAQRHQRQTYHLGVDQKGHHMNRRISSSSSSTAHAHTPTSNSLLLDMPGVHHAYDILTLGITSATHFEAVSRQSLLSGAGAGSGIATPATWTATGMLSAAHRVSSSGGNRHRRPAGGAGAASGGPAMHAHSTDTHGYGFSEAYGGSLMRQGPLQSSSSGSLTGSAPSQHPHLPVHHSPATVSGTVRKSTGQVLAHLLGVGRGSSGSRHSQTGGTNTSARPSQDHAHAWAYPSEAMQLLVDEPDMQPIAVQGPTGGADRPMGRSTRSRRVSMTMGDGGHAHAMGHGSSGGRVSLLAASSVALLHRASGTASTPSHVPLGAGHCYSSTGVAVHSPMSPRRSATMARASGAIANSPCVHGHQLQPLHLGSGGHVYLSLQASPRSSLHGIPPAGSMSPGGSTRMQQTQLGATASQLPSPVSTGPPPSPTPTYMAALGARGSNTGYAPGTASSATSPRHAPSAASPSAVQLLAASSPTDGTMMMTQHGPDGQESSSPNGQGSRLPNGAGRGGPLTPHSTNGRRRAPQRGLSRLRLLSPSAAQDHHNGTADVYCAPPGVDEESSGMVADSGSVVQDLDSNPMQTAHAPSVGNDDGGHSTELMIPDAGMLPLVQGMGPSSSGGTQSAVPWRMYLAQDLPSQRSDAAGSSTRDSAGGHTSAALSSAAYTSAAHSSAEARSATSVSLNTWAAMLSSSPHSALAEMPALTMATPSAALARSQAAAVKVLSSPPAAAASNTSVGTSTAGISGAGGREGTAAGSTPPTTK